MFEKVYLVKICPSFVDSPSFHFKIYQKILRNTSFLGKGLLARTTTDYGPFLDVRFPMVKFALLSLTILYIICIQWKTSLKISLLRSLRTYAECCQKTAIPFISISDCGKLSRTFSQAAGQTTTTGQVSSITTYLLLFGQIK